MRIPDSGSDIRTLTREDLGPMVWEAVNAWGTAKMGEINLVRAIRYDMLQFVYAWLKESDETSDN